MNYTLLKSGTDIRGVATEGVPNQPVNLTDEVIESIAGGFLLWCQSKLKIKAHELTLAVGHDSRISADRISDGLKRAFTSCGARVYDCGLASTPSMFMAVLEIPVNASVQITASHHPFNRNGLKFFTRDGGLDTEDISFILERAQTGACPPHAARGSVFQSDYMKKYSGSLREMIKREVNAKDYNLPLKGFKLVVDAGNGAGGFYARDVLAPLGADINGSRYLDPDGSFPNHIPNPEDKEAMKSICESTVNAGAELGIIFDTDVDRAGAVGPDGCEINRNALVALASSIALETSPGGTIVTDSITSDGLRDYIEKVLGGKHHRFKRGYKNVINEAVRLNSLGIDCPLAIETSGHAAMRENYFLDDGAYLITKIIIKLAGLKKDGKGLGDMLKDLRRGEEECELRFPITVKDFRPVGEGVIAALEEFAKKNSCQIAPDNYEGIRISFNENNGDGWLLLRMSVHDPILPLNIESNRAGGAAVIAKKLREFFKEYNPKHIDTTCLDKYLSSQTDIALK